MADTTVNYKCPNCGAPLTFIPGKDTVTCEYCNTEFEVATIESLYAKQEELAAKAQAAKEEKWEVKSADTEWSDEESAGLTTFTCSSCGAELVCDENTIATECCYCGNPTMIPDRFTGMLKPDFVIPFKKTKEDAEAALKEFYKGKLLLPDLFKKENRIKAIQPMYVPFWLFDSSVTASGIFKAENDMIVDTGDAIVTTTSVYQCEREGQMNFMKVPVDGSKKMDDTYMESIEPFDYSEMQPFSTAYLVGYLADKYDVESDAVVPRANERVNNTAVEYLNGTVNGFMRVSLMDSVINKDKRDLHYALAPVWIVTTQYNKQPYTFMMNGQTGKVVGSLPYDKKKALLYPTGAMLAAGLIGYQLIKLFLV